MPIDALSAEQLQDFLDRDVLLHTDIIVPVVATKQNAEKHGQEPDLTSLEKRVYDLVLAKLVEVEQLLETVAGKVPIEAVPPLDTIERGKGKSDLTYTIIQGHNVIEITQAGRPDFYWRVAIRDSGEPDHEITGFYHGCSSGNMRDIRDALENTKHLFPKIGSKLVEGSLAKTMPPETAAAAATEEKPRSKFKHLW